MRVVVIWLLCVFIVTVSLLIGSYIGYTLRDTQYASLTARNEKVCIVILLPNQGQMQQILNAIEPNSPLKVDYFIGADSRAKWDRVVNNACAIAYFKKGQRGKVAKGQRDRGAKGTGLK